MVPRSDHWTANDGADFVFSVGADFVAQLELKLEAEGLPQKELAARLSVSKGRISQILKNPGNLELQTIVNCALSLGMKATIVLYDDGDKKREYGPIHPEMFKICWERAGRPRDFWEFSEPIAVNVTETADLKGESYLKPFGFEDTRLRASAGGQ